MDVKQTYNVLKERVEEEKYINVSVGIEKKMVVSRTKLLIAIKQLMVEGYNVYYVKANPLDTVNINSAIILTKPEVSYTEVCINMPNIQ